MFPVIARDLRLSYGDIGMITGALRSPGEPWLESSPACIGSHFAAPCWRFDGGILAADWRKRSRRRSRGLVAVRILMGLADGAYTPPVLQPRSRPPPPGAAAQHRHSTMMLPLCGLGIAPLVVAALLRISSWRWVFLVFVIPGLLLAFAVWRVIPARAPAQPSAARSSFKDWRAVLAVSQCAHRRRRCCAG